MEDQGDFKRGRRQRIVTKLLVAPILGGTLLFILGLLQFGGAVGNVYVSWFIEAPFIPITHFAYFWAGLFPSLEQSGLLRFLSVVAVTYLYSFFLLTMAVWFLRRVRALKKYFPDQPTYSTNLFIVNCILGFVTVALLGTAMYIPYEVQKRENESEIKREQAIAQASQKRLEKTIFSNEAKTFEMEYPSVFTHETDNANGADLEIFKDRGSTLATGGVLVVARCKTASNCSQPGLWPGSMWGSFWDKSGTEHLRIGSEEFTKVVYFTYSTGQVSSKRYVDYVVPNPHGGYYYKISFEGQGEDVPFFETILSAFRFLE